MKNKKPAVIFLIIFAIVTLISLVSFFFLDIFDGFFDKEDASPYIFFYPADYNSDIMSEEEYLALDRCIMYSDGAVTWEISNDTSENPSGNTQAFLIKYIKALVAGDGALIGSMYSKQIIKELEIPEQITEQRIYEAVFTELSCTEVIENGEKFLRYEIKAEYKIQKNDGVFRDDLPSDAVKAQVLIIDEKNTSTTINGVIEYMPNKK